MQYRSGSGRRGRQRSGSTAPLLSPDGAAGLVDEPIAPSVAAIKVGTRIERVPLAFLADDAVIGRHPQFLRQQLQRLGLAISAICKSSAEQGFCQRSSLVRCGDLILLASAHTPVSIKALNDDDGVVVILPYGGQAEVSSQSQHFLLESTAEMAYLPGGNLQISSREFSSVIFRIDRLRLQTTTQSLMAAHGSIPQLGEDLQIARVFGADSEFSAALVLQLRRTVQMLDLACLQASGLLEALQLDELIYRILAELVGLQSHRDPKAGGPDPFSGRPTAMRDQILEDLIAWIHANLHRPIDLTELEQRSAYSRRSLQYTFKRRFGCSPMHWIRQQRLQRALSQLQHPEADTSVRQVAEACGYVHLSAFGRDFRNQFDLRASEVLRQARQRPDAAG